MYTSQSYWHRSTYGINGLKHRDEHPAYICLLGAQHTSPLPYRPVISLRQSEAEYTSRYKNVGYIQFQALTDRDSSGLHMHPDVAIVLPLQRDCDTSDSADTVHLTQARNIIIIITVIVIERFCYNLKIKTVKYRQ